MLKEFIDRENEIFNILNKLKDGGIDFILIGGYAISAFKRRFSVDAATMFGSCPLPRLE